MYNRGVQAQNSRTKKTAEMGNSQQKAGRSRKKLLPPGVSLLPVSPPGRQSRLFDSTAHKAPARGHEYLANGTWRSVSKSSPTPAYLSSTTVFCSTIMCHHRKPEKELGDFRVSSLQYTPEYSRVEQAVQEQQRSLLSPVRAGPAPFFPVPCGVSQCSTSLDRVPVLAQGAGPYIDPALPSSTKYCAFRYSTAASYPEGTNGDP